MREILDTLWVVAVTVWEFVVAAIKFLNDYNGAVTAAATVFIGAFTYVLARVTRRQADLTRQSIDLTRQDFLSTHRPVLRVRAFKLVGGSYKEIRFVVASVGAGTAYLLGSRGIIEFFEGKLPPVSYLSGEEPIPARRFLPGSTDEASVPYRIVSPTIEEAANRGGQLHVYGYLVYRDELGRTYTTAFCRVYNRESDRFSVVTDADYEYED